MLLDNGRGLIFLQTEKNSIEVLKVMNEIDVRKKFKRKAKRKREKGDIKIANELDKEEEKEETVEEYLENKANWVYEVQTKTVKEKIIDCKFISDYNSQLKNLLVLFYNKNYFEVFQVEEAVTENPNVERLQYSFEQIL